MRCYICNRETDNLRRDPDGKLVSICSVCRKYIYDCNRMYEDISDEDIRILKMSKKEFIKTLKEECEDANRPTKRNV